MTLSNIDAGRDWRLPVLDSEGQRRFWDRQKDSYELADMTNDNIGEQRAVEKLVDEFIASGYRAEDVVTLGGAVGCRDPRIVVDRFLGVGLSPGSVHFNDLSPALVARASEKALAPYRARGIDVRTIAGKITEVASIIPRRPRRVLIGVYRAEALTQAAPEQDYANDGLTEYLMNPSLVGERLVLEWFRIVRGAHVTSSGTRSFASRMPGFDADVVRNKLKEEFRQDETSYFGAVRVIGLPDNEEHGFFLSHWFTVAGLQSLVSESFGERAKRIRILPCPKGMVLCLDPLHKRPEGILTVLNNVVGNILPDEQLSSLRVIHELTE